MIRFLAGFGAGLVVGFIAFLVYLARERAAIGRIFGWGP